MTESTINDTDNNMNSSYINLQGQHEQSSLQIKSYRLQYMFIFMFEYICIRCVFVYRI